MAAPELRVLIVEDQEEARLLSAALLERHGLRVCGLRSGPTRWCWI